MLLTITTTHRPATDLGFLLAKHPEQCQTFELACGRAHVFCTEAEDDRCTVCLPLDLDPMGLVRGRRPSHGARTLAQYVNDRPCVASSFLSVAIAQVLGSALRGSSKARADLAATPIPLEAGISVVPCRGGDRERAALSRSRVRVRRPRARARAHGSSALVSGVRRRHRQHARAERANEERASTSTKER